MPDETEPTPAAPAPDDERPADRTEENTAARTGVQVPKWLAVGLVVVALAGGGFAIGRATASDHGGMARIGDVRGGPGQGGGFGGRGGPGFGPGGDRNGPGPGGDSNTNGNDGSNGPTTPSTTPATTGTTGA